MFLIPPHSQNIILSIALKDVAIKRYTPNPKTIETIETLKL
jgi:hypothetical protein